MGPSSFIWEGFVNPDSRRSVYSLSLARLQTSGSPRFVDGVNQVSTNITLGSANDEWYQGKPNALMTSLSNYSYGVDNFTFGRIYEENGVATSEYFYALGNTYPVTFSTNFKGLGLPANIYSEFVSLLEYVTFGDVECDNTIDGICTLPAPCANYTGLTEFDFKVSFTNEVNGNYVRVPLAAFAYNKLVTLGVETCNIDVNYLPSSNSQSQDIIMGGKFFQEFFGVFINDYNDPANPDQAAQIYVNENAEYGGYVGNVVLPTGVNPFVPTPPTPPSPNSTSGLATVWIIVICVVVAALLGFLGFLLYRYKMAAVGRGTQVVYTDGKQINASGANEPSADERRLLDV